MKDLACRGGGRDECDEIGKQSNWGVENGLVLTHYKLVLANHSNFASIPPPNRGQSPRPLFIC